MRSLPILTLMLLPLVAHSQAHQRARDLDIPFDGTPGKSNSITDVAGVKVGHSTIIRGSGPLVAGQGPVRTGVTAVYPRSDSVLTPVFAGWFSLNGNGEMTGVPWLEDFGELIYPVLITNTNSVGTVRDAVIEWGRTKGVDEARNCCLPVVAETWDGDLNDIFGFHVQKQHVFAALDSARAGPVAEGNVGGGTGMECLGFKGGIGTASRIVAMGTDTFTVGVLVQCNFGTRSQLRIAGIPVGREITAPPNCYDTRAPLDSTKSRNRCVEDRGSIIAIVATDAPLLPHQLKRVARRVSLGIGRVGGIASNGSGDLFLAFSTSPAEPNEGRIQNVRMLRDDQISPLYAATVQATEEAIINAMLAAETMTGADYLRVTALPHDQVRAILRRHNMQ